MSGTASPKARANDAARTMLGKAPRSVGAPGWLTVAEALLTQHDLPAAADALDRCDARLAEHRRPRIERRSAWMRPWVAGASSPKVTTPASEPSDGSVRLGLIDYRTPDRAVQSRNLGDYVQTLSALGHVARFSALCFTGDDGLASLARRLQGNVAPSLRRSGEQVDVELVPVFRDASSYQHFDGSVWALAFGWYMHSLFKRRFDFPFHPAVKPILVSFHCHAPSMLDPVTVEYLQRNGPVGCRDIATLTLLTAKGVPAFFSGCLTTTVNMGFPKLSPKDRPSEGSAVVVDTDAPDIPVAAPRVTHHDALVMTQSLSANVDAAYTRLDFYRRNYATLVTSRLHAYLPATALGMSVDFRPRRRNDPRFTGLAPLTAAEFGRMQTSLQDHIGVALGAITSGASDADVRRAWQESVGEDVERSRARVR